MSRRPPIWMILAGTLALAACSASTAAPDRPAPFFFASADQNAVDRRVGLQQRLNAVAFPILRGARPFCGTGTRLSHGLSVAAESPFAEANGYAYDDRGRRGDTPRLLYTVPGSPAHRAGLRGGDEILAVNGVRTARKGGKVLFRAMREGGGAPLWLLVRRGPDKRMAKVVPVAICDTPVVLAAAQEVVSWSTRSKVKVSEGMVRFVRTDTELALVVAHELSHIIVGDLSVGLQQRASSSATRARSSDAAPRGSRTTPTTWGSTSSPGRDFNRIRRWAFSPAWPRPSRTRMARRPTPRSRGAARHWLKPSRKSRGNEPPASIWRRTRESGADAARHERSARTPRRRSPTGSTASGVTSERNLSPGQSPR